MSDESYVMPCLCNPETVFTLDFSACSDDPNLELQNVCPHFDTWWITLHNTSYDTQNGTAVWSGSTSGSTLIGATLTCNGSDQATLTWSIQSGSCTINHSNSGNFSCGLTMQGDQDAAGICCGIQEPVCIAYELYEGQPRRSGTPQPVPPPCSNVPANEKDCCMKNGAGAGGAGGDGPGAVGGGPPRKGGGCGTGPGFSCEPVHYSSGHAKIVATDIESPGFGKPWGHTRSFAGRQSITENFGNGYNWQVAEWPYLAIECSVVVAQGRPNYALWFDVDGDDLVGRFGIKETLELDAVGGVYRLYELDGTVTEFDDETGQFVRQTDPAGNAIEVTDYEADGLHISAVQRSYTSGQDTTTEELAYDYSTSGGLHLLGSVTLRRRVNQGAWTNVARASYTYHDELDLQGLEGDLSTVTTAVWEDSQWNDTGTTLYRYYTESPGASSSSSSSGGSGAEAEPHLLKYVVNPSSYERLAADAQVSDPLEASDAKVAEYADYYFEYDSERRVTKESVRGGSMDYEFAYSESENDDGYNSWKFKTVETQPGSVTNTIYSNYAGQPMLQVYSSGSDEWLRFMKYDENSRLVLEATPAAITGYDEQYADLLHETAGSYQYLQSSDGLIHLRGYHAASGWIASESIQQGQTGTPIKLREYDYSSHTVEGTSSGASSSSSSSSSSSGSSSDTVSYHVSKETVYPSDTDQTKKIETTYAYTFYEDSHRVLQRTTTLPAVATSQNGSGTSATRVERYDTFGHPVWAKDERGYITHRQYDPVTGGLVRMIQDVDDSQLTVPTGWSTPAGGGKHVVTDFESDELGRVTQILGPEHDVNQQTIRSATWTVHDDASHEVRTARGYAVSDGQGGYTYTLVNPVTIRKSDAKGRVLEEIQATRASTSGKLSAADTFAQSSYTRWTTHQYGECCSLQSTRVYHTIPTSGEGSSGTNYDQTNFDENARGVQNYSETPGGTITRTVFDARDLPVAVYVGTDDTDATDADPTGNSHANNNMVLISETEYDSGSDGGNGLATEETAHVDSSTTRVTSLGHDWRGRSVTTDGELDYFEKRYYDNLDRVVKTERYDTNAQGNLVARSESFYDDAGRVYQTKRYAVNVDTGAVGNALVSNTWYDATGKKIKEQPAGSQAFTKTAYDSLARPVKRYVGHDTDETAYADASGVSDDTIVEQVETTYDDANNVIQTTTRQRFHNATGTGELTSPSGSQPKARVTYQASYADEVGRQIAVAEYGTYGGATFDRAAVVPNRTDTILVTSTEFNDAGQAYKTVDPAGKEHRTVFDDRARKVKTIQNYVDGNPATGGADEDVTVEMTYNADGSLETLTAKNSTTGDQTTTYVYGTTLSDSGVATSTLKRSEIYPDSDDTVALGDGTDGVYDRIEFKYDRRRQLIGKKDQNGSVHEYEFDALGRLVHDRVTTLGSSVDGAVRRVSTEYAVLGQVKTLTSYDNPTVGTGSVVNQVLFEYDEHRLLVKEYQEHDGVKDANTPHTGYSYDTTASVGILSKGLRLTSLRFPNGRLVHHTYGTTGSTGDVMSRVAAIKDDNSGSPGDSLAEYEYLGWGAVVQVDYAQPDLRLDMAHGTGSDPYDGAVDRFDRVVDLLWLDYASSSDVVHVKYGFDRAGNCLWREDPVAAGYSKDFDELHTYDGISQLVNTQRGNLNATKDGLVSNSKTFAEDWTLDTTGNWSSYRQDDDGDGTWELNQSRTHNSANEITQIAGVSTHVNQDRNGNMTKIPKSDDWGGHFDLTYDAWNRLVKVKSGTATVAEYQYDPRNFRIVKKTYESGELDEIRRFYYNRSWQCLEERVDSATTPECQFVWGVRYIDDLILCDRDTSQPRDGNLNERLYALQDANWSLQSLANVSGGIQHRLRYDAYGRSNWFTSAYQAQSGDPDWSYLFTNRRHDAETGMMYYRDRYFSPHLGRFLTRDPIGYYGDSENVYRYLRNAPVLGFDPYGRKGSHDFGKCEELEVDICHMQYKQHKSWWKLQMCNAAIPFKCGINEVLSWSEDLCNVLNSPCYSDGLTCACDVIGTVDAINIRGVDWVSTGLDCICDIGVTPLLNVCQTEDVLYGEEALVLGLLDCMTGLLMNATGFPWIGSVIIDALYELRESQLRVENGGLGYAPLDGTCQNWLCNCF